MRKNKWKNKILPRGIFVDPRGYVYVRVFHKGERVPKKSFGVATSASIDEAARYLTRLKDSFRTGRSSVEDQKAVRWPFPYAWEQYKSYCPKSRLYCGKPLVAFFGRWYFDELWFKIVEGYRPDRAKQGVSDSTINLELGVLSRMFHCLKELKQIGKIPNVVLPTTSPTVGVKKVDEVQFRGKRVITSEEFNIIMKEAPLRLQRRILAALHTGLRRKDIFSLKKDSYIPYMNQIEGLAHKVGTSYKVPANGVVANLFSTAESDQVIDDTNHNREMDALRRVCRDKHGMPDFTFKDLRRTAGMNIWMETKDILLCKAFYNHKKIETTLRYLGITLEDLKQAGDILGSKFGYQFQTVPKTVPINEKTTAEIKTKNVNC